MSLQKDVLSFDELEIAASNAKEEILTSMRRDGIEFPSNTELIIYDEVSYKTGDRVYFTRVEDKKGAQRSWYKFGQNKQTGVVFGGYGDHKLNVDRKYTAPPDPVYRTGRNYSNKRVVSTANEYRPPQKTQHEPFDNEWNRVQECKTQTEYLKRKKVLPHGIKQNGSTLLIPVYRINGDLLGIQYINECGSKRFAKGTNYQGCFHVIQGSEDIVVCEGYATGATIFECTGFTVYIAFCANNIENVVKELLLKNPSSTITIAADDDRCKDKNVGREEAVNVYKKYKRNCKVVFPAFEAATSIESSDFNDLYIQHGKAAVLRSFVRPTLEKLETVSTKELKNAIGFHEDTVLFLLAGGGSDSFFALDSTKGLTHKKMSNKKMIVYPERPEIQYKNVFSELIFRDFPKPIRHIEYVPGKPLYRIDDNTIIINSYRSPCHKAIAKTKKAELYIEKFLAHLKFLIPEEVAFTWFLDWMSHLIQNPEERLPCHPLMVSKTQGTGRGWITVLLQLLLGESNVSRIKCHHIYDNKFTYFTVSSVLCVCEEFSVRSIEQYEILKNFCSETVALVERKGVEACNETIRAHYLFQTNTPQLLRIDSTDRRLSILKCPNTPKETEYYNALYGLLSDDLFVRTIYYFLKNRTIVSNLFLPHEKSSNDEIAELAMSDDMQDILSFLRDANRAVWTLESARRFVKNKCSFHKEYRDYDIRRVLSDCLKLELKSIKHSRDIVTKVYVHTKYYNLPGEAIYELLENESPV